MNKHLDKTIDIWNSDSELKRAAELMNRIAISADKHQAKINGLTENTNLNNSKDSIKEIFRK